MNLISEYGSLDLLRGKDEKIQNVIRIESIYLYLRASQHISAMPQRTRERMEEWGGLGGGIRS